MDRFENCSNYNSYFNFMISNYLRPPVKFSHSDMYLWVSGLNSGMAVAEDVNTEEIEATITIS